MVTTLGGGLRLVGFGSAGMHRRAAQCQQRCRERPRNRGGEEKVFATTKRSFHDEIPDEREQAGYKKQSHGKSVDYHLLPMFK